MNVKTIFNMDKKTKKLAMLKARRDGLTLTAVLNIATRAYVSDRLKITASDLHLEKGLADIRAGRTKPAEEVFRKLGL